MSLFDEYYSEYTDLVNKVGSLTAELLGSNPFSSEQHETLGSAIEEALGEALDVVKQMEIHGRSLKKPKNRFVGNYGAGDRSERDSRSFVAKNEIVGEVTAGPHAAGVINMHRNKVILFW